MVVFGVLCTPRSLSALSFISFSFLKIFSFVASSIKGLPSPMLSVYSLLVSLCSPLTFPSPTWLDYQYMKSSTKEIVFIKLRYFFQIAKHFTVQPGHVAAFKIISHGESVQKIAFSVMEVGDLYAHAVEYCFLTQPYVYSPSIRTYPTRLVIEAYTTAHSTLLTLAWRPVKWSGLQL